MSDSQRYILGCSDMTNGAEYVLSADHEKEVNELKATIGKLSGGDCALVSCVPGSKRFTWMGRDPCKYGLSEVTYASLLHQSDAERDLLRTEVEALKKELKKHPSGVVLPERASENDGNSYSVMQAMARNQAIDEIALLNSSVLACHDTATMTLTSGEAGV